MKTFLEALCLGIIGGVAVYTGIVFQLPVWVMFMAWVSFSICKNSVKKSLNIFVQLVVGIFLAIAVQYGVDTLSPQLNNFTLPLIMCIVNMLLLYVAKTKTFNSIPAYFAGMIVWFASQSTPEINQILTLIAALVGGSFFAWLHASANKWILSKME